MKHHGRILALAALTCAAQTYAAPAMALGDNAEIFITAAASIKADDNIYLDTNNKQDDVILSFTPGFDLVFGRNAQTSGNFYYREEFVKYSDNDNQDTSLSHVGVNSLYSNGKSKFDAGASYNEIAQNDNDIRSTGVIVRRKVTNLRALSEFGVTEKTVLGVGLSYDKSDYGPASYTDSDIWNLPVDVYMEISPKLQASVGYRYRSSDLAGAAIDNEDHFLSVGARGEFTAKLTGQVRVGYLQRKFDVGGDDSSIGVDSSLTLAYSEKTSYQIGLTNDYGNSGTGQSTKNTSISVSTNSRVDEQWSWNAGLSFKSSEYPDRTDDFLQGTAGIRYVVNSYFNVEANYVYLNNASDSAAAEFTGSSFGIGANLRY